MALSESRLSGKIVTIIDVIKTEEKDSESIIKKFSDALAKAIVEEMRLAVVTGVCPPTGGALTLGKIN